MGLSWEGPLLGKVLVTQSCPTLCDPMGCSPSSFSVNDIFPARILEWDTFPSPGDLPNPEIEPGSPALQTDALLSELLGKPSESCSVMSDSLRPRGLYSPWNSPGQNTGVDKLSLPNPGIEPRSPALQADSLPAKPQGKTKNTGVGSLSLVQWIFPIQELNRGLLHLRRILYQLSYQSYLDT